jgi:large subunit ribosomal protein L6
MSRVGKNPVAVPAGVEVTVGDDAVLARGKLGELSVALSDLVEVVRQDNEIQITPKTMAKRNRQMWGTMRANIQNAVKGVSEGFVKRIEINGVGYRAAVQGSTLRLQLGFSHDVNFPIPSDVKIAMEGDKGNVIAISGSSAQRVGQIASEIRAYRPPEPYKGKGLKYSDEKVVRKEGKKK